MVFSSLTFLLYFLPLFFLMYYLSPKRFRNAVLLVWSVAFYAWGAPKFVFILLLSTIVDFYLVGWMHRTVGVGKKKGLLALSICLNLGLLAYFKYANFFVENVQGLVGEFQWKEVILPIGISFYTFQTLTYSIDVFRGKSKPLRNVWDYLVYILMFPQLIAGPIVRFNRIAKELVQRDDKIEQRIQGAHRFLIGLAKKVLIANPLGAYVDFRLGEPIGWMSTPDAWLVMLCYTFQIFFDFSGYSDMAIGLGKMMGFTFPENFNRPYRSRSITEFWRRWHITLGEWMRDYLYIPLGGNRVSSNTRLYFNLVLVFFLSGLWHGASWNFVLWGLFHGTFLILDRLFLLRWLKRIPRLVAIVLTFFITIHGWVIFRIESFQDAMAVYGKMYAFEGGFRDVLLRREMLFAMLVAIVISFIPKMDWTQERWGSGKYIRFTIASILLGILSISFITSSDFNPFIYFRF